MQITSKGHSSNQEVSPTKREFQRSIRQPEFGSLNTTAAMKRYAGVVLIVFSLIISGTVSSSSTVLGQEVQTGETQPRTPAELQQLVAPIALYPDELVAQVLAACTYPTEIVQADRWLSQHSNLQSATLAAEVDKQSWDPSVKSLTAFPSVLANLDKNLSWTSTLGDAYFNQQQDVLDAVQIMRKRAETAGTLQSTTQQKVITQGPTIIIEPVDERIFYLPAYDPWIVYGAPIAVYPGYIYDAWFGPPYISFGVGVSLGFFGHFGWGWPAWGFNWGRREVIFNHTTYISRSRFFSHGFSGSVGGFRSNRSGIAPGNHAFRTFERNRVAGPTGRSFNGSSNSGFNNTDRVSRSRGDANRTGDRSSFSTQRFGSSRGFGSGGGHSGFGGFGNSHSHGNSRGFGGGHGGGRHR
jgi:hypothetical protein